MNTQNIYNLIILDASGSMQSIYEQALTGVNETIATIRMAQKEHPEMKQFLTLASFSAGERFLNRIYTAMPIDEVHDITRKDYPLLGCTALYDAMGTTITELQKVITHEDRVLVTIITDGYENASCVWSGEQIKSLVEELRQMGWTFTYIGADQDVEKVAGKIGVRNSLRFSSNPQATQQMFEKERSSRANYYRKMSGKLANRMSSLIEEDSFFTPDEPQGNDTQEAGQTTQYEAQPKPTSAERPENKKSFFERLFGK